MKNFFKAFYVKYLRRKRAGEILSKYPFFFIDDSEFIKHCHALEQSFAGIVLGRCVGGIGAKIIDAKSKCQASEAYSLPLGYFGEIICQSGNKWSHTGLYGFVDQCDRLWCCGKISDTILYDGEYFFPFCIEPAFETLLFVKNAKLIKSPNCTPSLEITLRLPFRFKFLKNFLSKILHDFAARFAKTKSMEIKLVH